MHTNRNACIYYDVEKMCKNNGAAQLKKKKKNMQFPDSRAQRTGVSVGAVPNRSVLPSPLRVLEVQGKTAKEGGRSESAATVISAGRRSVVRPTTGHHSQDTYCSHAS